AGVEVLVGRGPLDAVADRVEPDDRRGTVDDDADLGAEVAVLRAGGAVGVEVLDGELVLAVAVGGELEPLLAVVEVLEAAQGELGGPLPLPAVEGVVELEVGGLAVEPADAGDVDG